MPAFPIPQLRQLLPFVEIDMSLIQDTSEGANGNLAFSRHYGRIHCVAGTSDEFDVTTLLTGFGKTRCFEPAFNLAEGLRLKPPQPQPQ